MTAQRISMFCWIFFVIMSVGFLGVGAGIEAITAIPAGPRTALAIIAVVVLWWGPFMYAMYLAWAVKYGDPRLLAKGTHGMAVVMSGHATGEVISTGEFDWQAPTVWKYHLKVALPGHDSYETNCSLCADNLETGATVKVAVSPHNRKRVAIDIGSNERTKWWRANKAPRDRVAEKRQTDAINAAIVKMEHNVSGGTPAPPSDATDASDAPSPMSDGGPGVETADLISALRRHNHGGPAIVIDHGHLVDTSNPASEVDALAKLGDLHTKGVLTDAEFATEKAKLLGESSN